RGGGISSATASPAAGRARDSKPRWGWGGGWPCRSTRSRARARACCSRQNREDSIVPKFAANLTMLFNEMPFIDRFAAAKAAGFSGVEFLFPYDFDKVVLREKLERYGLSQVLHNLPAGDWAAGERGIAVLPDLVA